MELAYIRLASVLVIAFVYMVFDIFNNRNIPTVFVYSTLAYGALLTILYLETYIILESLAIAAAILSIGYVLYRIGQLGAADVVEIAAISLILPIQNILPVHVQLFQLLPFALSVVVNSGIVALIIVPLYYVPKSYLILRHEFLSKVDRKDVYRGVISTVAYSLFFLFLIYYGISFLGFVIMCLAIICIAVITLFEKPMTMSMVSYQKPERIYEEDIIALNLMNNETVSKVKRSVPEFGRLMTGDILNKLREKEPDTRLPVYRNAIPFALPIFIGIVLALFVGNVLAYIVPFGI